MKKELINEFYQKIFTDEKFLSKLVDSNDNCESKDYEEKVISIIDKLILPEAKKRKYYVDREEIIAFEKDELTNYQHKNIKKLSNEELDSVSGGSIIKGILSLSGILWTMVGGGINTNNIVPNVSQAGNNMEQTISQVSSAGLGWIGKSIYDIAERNAKVRYIKNMVMDATDIHQAKDIVKKPLNWVKGEESEPETEESFISRTGVTAVSDVASLLKDVGFNFDYNKNVAVMTGNSENGGIGCSADALCGYVKEQVGGEKIPKVIVLKGFEDVQLGGISPTTIIQRSKNDDVISVRIVSELDPNVNFLYYPKTNQMYVAKKTWGNVPTITSSDLSEIEKISGKSINIIKICGWISSIPGFRQELKFEKKLIDAGWKDTSGKVGNYVYSKEKSKITLTRKESSEINFSKLWFSPYLINGKNDVYIDGNGVLTLNFKTKVNTDITLLPRDIDILVDYCNQKNKTYEWNQKTIRFNLVGGSNVSLQDNTKDKVLITAIVKNRFATKDSEKYSNITVKLHDNTDKDVSYNFDTHELKINDNSNGEYNIKNDLIKKIIFALSNENVEINEIKCNKKLLFDDLDFNYGKWIEFGENTYKKIKMVAISDEIYAFKDKDGYVYVESKQKNKYKTLEVNVKKLDLAMSELNSNKIIYSKNPIKFINADSNSHWKKAMGSLNYYKYVKE